VEPGLGGRAVGAVGGEGDVVLEDVLVLLQGTEARRRVAVNDWYLIGTTLT